ncbi:hypothetical protein HGRIS_010496 [Hohenbuehelia grisea]|uniref:Uncharacterized protein n=1 Tax=Hohenbuehelia grisea TaxID=104357 RepID=A0ABR3IX97_9AGAR
MADLRVQCVLFSVQDVHILTDSSIVAFIVPEAPELSAAYLHAGTILLQCPTEHVLAPFLAWLRRYSTLPLGQFSAPMRIPGVQASLLTSDLGFPQDRRMRCGVW